MIAPHELRKKEFTRTMRGYSTQEVDEYVSYLIKNYVELYRQYGELEKRMRNVMAQNDELSKDTRAIRAALLDAQRAADKIVGDAKEEAHLIVSSAKRSCDAILNEFHVLVEKERAKLVVTHNAVADFKAKLYADYQAHIDRIAEITEDPEIPDIDEEALTKRIITDIKADAARWAKNRKESEEPAPKKDDAPDPEIFDAANKAEEEDIANSEEPVREIVETEPIPEVDGYQLDTELTADPPVEDDTATRMFDPVSDNAEEAAPEPEEEKPEDTSDDPKSEKNKKSHSDDYDDQLAELAAELSRELPDNDNN